MNAGKVQRLRKSDRFPTPPVSVFDRNLRREGPLSWHHREYNR
jgi:hypothetical protein